MNSLPSDDLLDFAPISSHCKSSWEVLSSTVKAQTCCLVGGRGIKSLVQPLQIGREGEGGRFPSWGKGLVMQLGENQTKQLLFPSGSEWVCDVKVKLSLPKD